MYQVAWQRILTVNYGVGTISITLIVSVYMFGMGVGALLGGFLAERVRNRILLYFAVELLIGCFGLISIPFLDYLGRHTAGSSYLLSFFYMFLFLSIPTILMGITLPLLTKIFNKLIQNFLNTVSLLYFINTLGAAIGAVFASYAVISFFGLNIAVYLSVLINFVLAALIFLARYLPSDVQQKEDIASSDTNNSVFLGKVVYLLVFITGFLAIGYEIAWFRVIGILVKASPYAFSSILSVYLLGIAIGSFGMSKYLESYRQSDYRTLFFMLQVLIGVYVILVFCGYFYLTKYTPFSVFTHTSFGVNLHPFFKVPSLESAKAFAKDIFVMVDVFFWPLVFVFIPTIFMGASFPLISLLALSSKNKEGETIGRVYFFNISGNVLGGIVTGFILLPLLGTENTLLTFSLTGILLGLCINSFNGRHIPIAKRAVAALAMIFFALLIFPGQGQLYEIMHISPGDEFEPYFEENIDGIVMTYQHGEKTWNYINGLMHGLRPSPASYYEAAEAVSFAPGVDNILIIGYGTGSIAEAVLRMDNTKRVTLIELSDALIDNLTKIPLFEEMLSDNRLNLIIDDGRRFLLRTDEKYDLILIDPLRSTTAYSNNLYSRQFFELANEHLKPGGIFMVWMDEYRVMPNTVMSAFEHSRVYDFFCLGSNRPFRENQELRLHVLESFTEDERAKILLWGSRESGDPGDTSNISRLTKGYPVNSDLNPVTEYYIGLKAKERFLY